MPSKAPFDLQATRLEIEKEKLQGFWEERTFLLKNVLFCLRKVAELQWFLWLGSWRPSLFSRYNRLKYFLSKGALFLIQLHLLFQRIINKLILIGVHFFWGSFLTRSKVQLFWEGYKNCTIFLMVWTFTVKVQTMRKIAQIFFWPSEL